MKTGEYKLETVEDFFYRRATCDDEIWTKQLTILTYKVAIQYDDLTSPDVSFEDWRS